MTSLKTIATIRSDFPEKFGVPRQSNLVNLLEATIVFQPEYRNPDALRGLEDFSHLWLIWGFSLAEREEWSPTVRPPRLGGNTRMGVFATRSPYRPNPLGLSSVKLAGIEWQTKEGPVIHVLGADLMDKTPIYDIKPYLPFVDSHPEASCGFASRPPEPCLKVVDEAGCLLCLPEGKRDALASLLSLDPRPAYQQDGERIYGMGYAGYQVCFTVEGDLLRLVSIEVQEKHK